MENSPLWLGSLLFHGMIVLGGGILLSFLIRKQSGANRRCLWCGVWIALVILPVLSAFMPRHFGLVQESVHQAPQVVEWVSRQLPDESPLSEWEFRDHVPLTEVSAEIEPAQVAEIEPAQDTTIPLVLLIWGGGMVILSGRLLLGSCLLSLLIRKARRVPDKDLPGFLKVVDFLKLKRIPSVYASSRVRVPMCCGVFRPTILLPESLIQSDKAETLELVLLHEGVHLQQRDALWLWLAHFAVTVHWVNPLAWFAMSRFRLAQEQTCDDVVLGRNFSAAGYSTLLVSMVKESGSPSLLTSALTLAMARPSILKKRLRHILDPKMKRNKPNRIRRIITVMSFLTLAAAACTIGLRQSTAQETPAEPAEEEGENRLEGAQEVDQTEAAAQALDDIMIDDIEFYGFDLYAVVDSLKRKTKDAKVNFVVLREAFERREGSLIFLSDQIQEKQEEMAKARDLRDDLANQYGIFDEIHNSVSDRLRRIDDQLSVVEQRIASSQVLHRQVAGLEVEQRVRYLLRQNAEGSSLLKDAYQSFLDAKKANDSEEIVSRAKEAFLVELELQQKSMETNIEIAISELEVLKQSRRETLQRAIERRDEINEYRAAEATYQRAKGDLESLEKAHWEYVLKSSERELPRITLRLRNVSLSGALSYITEMMGLSYIVNGPTIVIGTHEDISAFSEKTGYEVKSDSLLPLND